MNENQPEQFFVVSLKGNAARRDKLKPSRRNCIRTRMHVLDPPEPIKRPRQQS